MTGNCDKHVNSVIICFSIMLILWLLLSAWVSVGLQCQRMVLYKGEYRNRTINLRLWEVQWCHPKTHMRI